MTAAPAVLVEFAAQPGEAEGDYVVCRAPVICRAGDYAFKDAPPFRLTPDDIRREAEDFRPVPIDDTHGSRGSVFHGKLGEVAALEPSADFGQFGGLVRFPQWLYKLYKGATIPLSATFDRLTKRLKSVALVADPRIPDAHARLEALEAAFAAAHAPPEATPVSTEVKPPPADADARLRELERREAEWKAEREELKRQAAQTAAQFAAEQRKGRRKAAAEFAAALIHGERVADGKVTPGPFTPAARPALTRLAEFALAHQDEHGDATFSADDGTEAKAPLLAVLKDAVANLRPRALSAEDLRGSAEFGNDPGDGTKEQAKKDRERMLAATDVGRRILAEEKNGAK